MRRRERTPDHLDLFGDYLIKMGAPAETEARPGVSVMQPLPQQQPTHTGFERGDPGRYGPEFTSADMLCVTQIRLCLRDAARMPPGRMFSRQVVVTPRAAAWILEHYNLGNRPLSQTKIKRLAKMIKKGQWKCHHQGVSFSTDPKLNNGQHRLHAIVLSGEEAEIYFTFNERRNVFDVIDTHEKRRASDVLTMEGYTNTTCLASAARMLRDIELGAVFNREPMENEDVLTFAGEHPELQDAARLGQNLGCKLRCSSAAVATALYNIKTKSKHADRFQEVYDLLYVGNISDPKSPLLYLREGLRSKKLDEHVRTSNEKTFVQYVAFISAWNRLVKGKSQPTRADRWRHTDPIPSVI